MENRLDVDCSDMQMRVEDLLQNNNLKDFIVAVVSKGLVHHAVLAGPTLLGELKPISEACKRHYSVVTPQMDITLSAQGVWNVTNMKKDQVFVEKEDGFVIYLFCYSDQYPKMPRNYNKTLDTGDSPESVDKDMLHGEATSDFGGKSLISASLEGSMRLAKITFIERRRTFCDDRLGRTVERENPVELTVTTLAETKDVFEAVMSWTSDLCLDGETSTPKQCVSAAYWKDREQC